MALTDVKIHKIIAGNAGKRDVLISFKGPASYTQYGETVKSKDFGVASFWGANTAIGYNSSGQGLWKADLYLPSGRGEGIISGKIIITDLADGEEAAAASDLDEITFQMIVSGQ